MSEDPRRRLKHIFEDESPGRDEMFSHKWQDEERDLEDEEIHEDFSGDSADCEEDD